MFSDSVFCVLSEVKITFNKHFEEFSEAAQAQAFEGDIDRNFAFIYNAKTHRAKYWY